MHLISTLVSGGTLEAKPMRWSLERRASCGRLTLIAFTYPLNARVPRRGMNETAKIAGGIHQAALASLRALGRTNTMP